MYYRLRLRLDQASNLSPANRRRAAIAAHIAGSGQEALRASGRNWGSVRVFVHPPERGGSFEERHTSLYLVIDTIFLGHREDDLTDPGLLTRLRLVVRPLARRR